MLLAFCYNKSGFSSSLIGGAVKYIKASSNIATTVLRTVVTAIGGGTASLLGGGKFANGAFSGAFVYLFNHYIELKPIDINTKYGYKIADKLRRIMNLSDAEFVKKFNLSLDPIKDRLDIFIVRYNLYKSFYKYILAGSANTAKDGAEFMSGAFSPPTDIISLGFFAKSTYGTFGGSNRMLYEYTHVGNGIVLSKVYVDE